MRVVRSLQDLVPRDHKVGQLGPGSRAGDAMSSSCLQVALQAISPDFCIITFLLVLFLCFLFFVLVFVHFPPSFLAFIRIKLF